jgi:hypothetical protein
MKSLVATVGLFLAIHSTTAGAQSEPPPNGAATPAPAEAPPAPPAEIGATPAAAETPPPPARTIKDVAQPSVTSAPADAPPAPHQGTKLAVAVQSSGFFSTLDNGIFVGGQGASGTVWGVGLSVSATKLGNAPANNGVLFVSQPTSQTAFGFSIYPGAKFVLASAGDGRVDLVGDWDLGFTKYYATDGVGTAMSDGYGVWTHLGVGPRLWVTPSLALSYSALLDVLVREGRAATIPGQVVSDVVVDSELSRAGSETTVGFFGRLTLLGVF